MTQNNVKRQPHPVEGDRIMWSLFALQRHMDDGPETDFPTLNRLDILDRTYRGAGQSDLITPGYRDGVVLVDIEPKGIRSPTVVLEEGDILEGVYEARVPGETPRKRITVKGKSKSPAARVQVVLYRRDVLEEDADYSDNGGDWEIVSVNGAPTMDDQPMGVGTLMHNHFGSSGGTDTKMTDAEFIAQLKISFEYGKDKIGSH